VGNWKTGGVLGENKGSSKSAENLCCWGGGKARSKQCSNWKPERPTGDGKHCRKKGGTRQNRLVFLQPKKGGVRERMKATVSEKNALRNVGESDERGKGTERKDKDGCVATIKVRTNLGKGKRGSTGIH